ncbi:hypothetical protein [Effusibacillus pohliae]|uniref:hypothetical protein n=1 Tax=Effusibacillus pohliae TaxID=232270 RepID=UPI000361EFF0|nr:hypothetical protein [Effusibacillus pohliae]
MWQTILDLFTYPGKTIDRLLAEKNYMRSNQIFFLTMVVVSLSAVLSLYLLQTGVSAVRPWLIVLVAIGPIGGLLFSRFLFRMLVQLALRMVNRHNLPSDPAERRERARYLYLLYPYHVLPLVVPAILLPLAVAPTAHDSPHLLAKLVLMIGVLLLGCGTFVLQLIVMVHIVKRVYHVSAALAFWGPLFAYLLFAVLAGILGITVGLLGKLAFGLLG